MLYNTDPHAKRSPQAEWASRRRTPQAIGLRYVTRASGLRVFAASNNTLGEVEDETAVASNSGSSAGKFISSVRLTEYSASVMGLVYFRLAGNAFTKTDWEFKGKGTDRRAIGNLV
jgi:hypothetical protein